MGKWNNIPCIPVHRLAEASAEKEMKTSMINIETWVTDVIFSSSKISLFLIALNDCSQLKNDCHKNMIS